MLIPKLLCLVSVPKTAKTWNFFRSSNPWLRIIESQQYSSVHIDASTNTRSLPLKKKSSSSLKMKLQEYLEEQNVRPKDVAKVLLAFKLCAWSTWIVLVPICGKLRPIRRLSQMSGPQRLKSWFIRTYPNRYERWEEHIIKGSEWIAKLKTVRWIPEAFCQRHRDFGLSIAEATVLYKVNLLYQYQYQYQY